MRGLGLAGLIALAFGVASYYVTGEPGVFGRINLAVGGLALLAGLVGGALRALRGLGTPAARGLLLRRAALVVALLAGGVALERFVAARHWRFDLTLDRRYELSPASREVLKALPPGLTATLYYDPGDPRIRGTRLLLDSFAATGEMQVRERNLDAAAEEADRLGISSSDTVVLQVGDGVEVVGRPTEGTLWEGLERLRRRGQREVIYVSRGAGEGDFLRPDELGYSGLATALQTEGYDVRDLVLAAVDAIPADAAAVIVMAPERRLRPESTAHLEAYLEGGGGLLLFLEPGRDAGLGGLIEHWGFASPDGVVVDPASGPVEGNAPGVNPLAYAYADHPITAPLDANRMTFFAQARPVEAVRKPQPQDRLVELVFSSPRAWLSRQVKAIARGAVPDDRDGQPPDRFPLVSAGRYPRRAGETRMVVFGDSDLASNAYLRALYNLDLVMNAVAWVAQRPDEALTRRPNVLTVVQDPLTPQQTLTMFYGVGLLLPELLLIAAALSWVRRRG